MTHTIYYIYYIRTTTKKEQTMKKIITLILIAVTFSFAMTLSESRSEVNHCHTRFENAIDGLKNCKIDRKTYDKEDALFLKCKNGVYLVSTDLKVETVVVKTAIDSIIVHLGSKQTGREFCTQVMYDEFGVREKFEYLHYYKEDNEQIYNYAKNKLLKNKKARGPALINMDSLFLMY